MSIIAWPFLVSRNTTFDYRVVVAPEYMVENRVSSLLAKAAGGDVTTPLSAYYRKVFHPNPEVGDSILLFRIVEANNAYIGLEGNESLKDNNGRTILLIEGFVVKGLLADSDKIVVTEDDLLEAHRRVQEYYQKFWYETDSTPPVRSSKPFDLPLEDLSRKSISEKVLRLKEVPEYTVRPKVSAELKQPEPISSQIRNSSQQTSLHSTSPKTKKQWIDEGDLLAAVYSYDEALNAYDQALRLPSIDSRDDAPAHRGKGDVFYYQHSFEEADQAYNQALECDKKYALAYNGKGLICHSRGNYKEAIKFFEQAIQLDHDCALAYANRGFSLRKEPHKLRSREKEIHKAFEDAVEAYNRLMQTEEKAIWYYYLPSHCP